MKLHYLQHVAFEGLGSIGGWAEKRSLEVAGTRLFADEPLPEPDDLDLLVVLGGPMNIYEDNLYPWLVREKTFISHAINEGKLVLGICLGAQLIADALGARIFRNEHKEIGWFPIQLVEEGASLEVGAVFPSELEGMHWHGDTFDLPQGSVHLARSAVCQNQGFVYRQKVIGLQFHLETTPQSLQSLVSNCDDELVDGPYIQSAESMFAEPSRFDAINGVMDKLLDVWAG